MLILAALMLAAAPADTAPTLKKCGAPVAPIGILFSAGYASFTVSPKGVPDSTSIVIPSMERGTAAGLRSALARELPACRFQLPHAVRGSAAVRVMAHVAFDSDVLRFSEVRVDDPGDTLGIPTAAERPGADQILSFTDDSLEEKPASECSELVPRDEVTVVAVIRGNGNNRQQAGAVPNIMPQPVPSYEDVKQGSEVLLRYVVSAEGKVLGSSIQIVASPSDNQSSMARHRVTNCHWTPGRIHGQPVAVSVAQRQKF